MEKTQMEFSSLVKRWEGFIARWGCYLVRRVEMWGKRWELLLHCKTHLGSFLVKPSTYFAFVLMFLDDRNWGKWKCGNLTRGQCLKLKWRSDGRIWDRLMGCCLLKRLVSGICWLPPALPIKGPTKSSEIFFYFFLTQTEEAPKFLQLDCQHHSRCGPHHEQDYNLQCQPHKSISVVQFLNLNPYRFDFSLSGGRLSQWTVKKILFSDIIICFCT